MSTRNGSVRCTLCSKTVVAFSTPFHVSLRASARSSRRACSWTTRPALRGRVSSFRGRRVAQSRKLQQTDSEVLRIPPRAMFSGGGFFGVGTSEVIVIVAVGWVLLGPEKLFSLAKDSGKVLGQLRRTADEARETFSEALDLDTLAAEAKALSTEFESAAKGETVTKERENEADGLPDAISDTEVAEEHPEAKLHIRTTASPDMSATETELSSTESQVGGSAAFLDQLRRVSDPDQVAPSEVPDLSVDIDKLEVERLEEEYMEAKRKLEERRAQSKIEGTSDVKPGIEGR